VTEPDQLSLFLAPDDDGSFEWFMRHGPSQAETPQTKGRDAREERETDDE
jgi:hypothetical protein